MNEEAIERVTSSRVTRRTIVTTGTKLAYAAPLVAASFKLTGSGVLATDGWVTLPVILCGELGNDFCVVADTPGQNDGCKTVICHRTCSDSNPYIAIDIARDCGQSDSEALAAHLLQHNPTEKCDREDVLAINVTCNTQRTHCTGDCPGGGVGGPSPIV